MDTVLRREQLDGLEVHTAEGDRLGKIEDIYFDAATDCGEWVAVRAGFLGRKRLLVPLLGAGIDGTRLRLAYMRRQLESLPVFDEASFTSDNDERLMFVSFGLDYPGRSFGYQGGDYMVGGVPVNDMPQERFPGSERGGLVGAAGHDKRRVPGGSVRLQRWSSRGGKVILPDAIDLDRVVADGPTEQINATEAVDDRVDDQRNHGELRMNGGLGLPRRRDR
ncbi:MAG: PRC-barrel domain-containing protein [Thermoleophilia bacterium]|nr:PRC-barrel domain-containing protein [Thermoleophilia bacterium]